MTFEELKAEAKKQGYKLTKEIKYEKLQWRFISTTNSDKSL